MSTKKKNFTERERQLLIEILKCFKHIIENKKTDSVSVAQKKDAWREISNKFNASSIACETASGDQLKRLWQNIKNKQRDALTKERQHRLATGGGAPCADVIIDPNVADITPGLLVEITDAVDSDAPTQISITSEEHQHNQLENNQHLSPLYQSISPSTFNREDQLSQYPTPTQAPFTSEEYQHNQPEDNRDMHRTPYTYISTTQSIPTQPCSTSTRETTIEEVSQNAGNYQYSKIEKKLRSQILLKEHLKRIKNVEEEHEIQLKLLKEKLKFTLEENDLKRKILQEQLREAIAKADLAEKNKSQSRNDDL